MTYRRYIMGDGLHEIADETREERRIDMSAKEREKGPREFGRSGTAHDSDQLRPQATGSHDSEVTGGAQENSDPASEHQNTGESPAAKPVYDSGWTTRGGFSVRVRWYGVPDDGRRRRWLTDLISREANDARSV